MSEYLGESLRREFNPTPADEASQFYRRGTKYNAIGGLKGTHAWAFVWAFGVVLPLFIVFRVSEGVWDMFRKMRRP